MSLKDREPCKGCGTKVTLFWCYHVPAGKPYSEGYNCGYCVKCCPERLVIIDNLPEEDKARASKAISLIPEGYRGETI